MSFDSLYVVIFAQTFLLTTGLLFFDYGLSVFQVFVTIGTALGLEILLNRGAKRLPASAIAIGLGIVLFLRATETWYYALAAIVAILSKRILRLRGRHIFNPSNFAVLVMVFGLPFTATIEFTQWGSNSYFFALASIMLLIAAYQARVIVTTLSFLGTYVLGITLLASQYALVITPHHYGLLSPTLLLFASFMITDPKTTPTGLIPRMLHGFGVAAAFFILEFWGVRYSLFVAAFIMTIFNVFSSEANLFFRKFFKIRKEVPKNIISTFIVVIVFVVTISNVSKYAHAPWEMPSLSFLLFGIESDSLLRCSSEPAFGRADAAGLKSSLRSFGVAWGDYNNDGYDDVLVSGLTGGTYLAQNNRNGTFTHVSADVGFPDPQNFKVASAVFVDYDNDGFQDIFMVMGTGASPIRVYKNVNGKSFIDVTAELGLSDVISSNLFSGYIGAFSFADYDNDGDLDFVFAEAGQSQRLESKGQKALWKTILDPRFARPRAFRCDANFIEEHKGKIMSLAKSENLVQEVKSFFRHPNVCVSVQYGLSLYTKSIDTAFGPITSYMLAVPGEMYLFENKTDFFVERESFSSMLHSEYVFGTNKPGRNKHPYDDISWIFYQPVSLDYNNDGMMDLFVSVDHGSNLMFENVGNWEFKNVTSDVGINYSGSGMGVAVGDIDNDQDLDMFVDNVWEDYLFINDNTKFRNQVEQELMIGVHGVGWGTAFIDYNLDGWSDIVIASGDTSENTQTFNTDLSRTFFRQDNLYRNQGNGAFFDVSNQLCSFGESGRALAISDYDNDGDEDILIGNISLRHSLREGVVYNRLYENLLESKSFLQVRLKGTKSNAMGIGAYVTASTPDLMQTKMTFVGSSFYSQNSQKMTFGFGEYRGPIDVTVEWPSGLISRYENVTPDQEILVTEGESVLNL